MKVSLYERKQRKTDNDHLLRMYNDSLDCLCALITGGVTMDTQVLTDAMIIIDCTINKLRRRGLSDRAIYYWFEYASPSMFDEYQYELLSVLDV